MTSFAAQLAARHHLAGPVALVAAHPDDETIGAGIAMSLMGGLLLVHVTDGAPPKDARAQGFDRSTDYASVRQAELHAALAAGNITAHCISLAAPDQHACRDMRALAQRLADLLRAHATQVIVTHAFEGGHPDHDATCLITHLAARLLPTPPAIVEMASYNAYTVGDFLRGGPAVETLHLTDSEQARKRAMLDAFASQRLILADFSVETERFRMAPEYDFTRRPHDGPLHYEKHDWGLDFVHWQALAASCL